MCREQLDDRSAGQVPVSQVSGRVSLLRRYEPWSGWLATVGLWRTTGSP
jgi:hypothetical protein